MRARARGPYPAMTTCPFIGRDVPVGGGTLTIRLRTGSRRTGMSMKIMKTPARIRMTVKRMV